MKKVLYLVTTIIGHKCYVLASSEQEASDIVIAKLNELNIGYKPNRVINSITPVLSFFVSETSDKLIMDGSLRLFCT